MTGTPHRSDEGRIPVALSSFVGRERELAAVVAALREARVVCLTGPGGDGKTRLAMAVAAELRPQFRGRLWWVDLAALADPASVPRALANAVGVRESAGRPLLDSVITHLDDDEGLLVIDNCEHLLPGCAESIAAVLTACSRVRVLATSREVLGVSGEVVWPVPPLSVPGRDATDDIGEYEAVRLFCDRAAALRPGFALDADNAPAIARICRRLDGLPLAVELAAAQIRALTVDEIADTLDHRLMLLAGTGRTGPDRHRTLGAALAWSHRLLTEPERRIFAELSVFQGGFTLDAAQAVHAPAADDSQVVALLTQLVDRSLLTSATTGRRTRYNLLEPVRMYAAEELERSGRTAEVAERHVAYVIALTEQAEPELFGAGQREWLDRLDADRANLAAAMRWTLSARGRAEDGLRVIAPLCRFAYLRGYYSEGRGWADAALAAAPDAELRLRAKVLSGSGNIAYLECDYAGAIARLEEALTAFQQLADDGGVARVLQCLGSVARERAHYERSRELHEQARALAGRLGDGEESARALNYLALLAWLQGDLDNGASLAQEALAQFRRLGDAEGIAWALLNLGAIAGYGEKWTQGEALLRESLASSRSVGYREGVAWSLNQLGVLAARQGRTAAAAELLRSSLHEHWDLGDRWRAASVLEALAGVAAADGHHERAARWIGAAAGLRAAIGAPVPPIEQADLDRTRRQLANGDGQQHAAASRLGGLAAIETVVAEALEPAGPPPVPIPAPNHLVVRAAPPRIEVTALGTARVRLDSEDVPTADFGYAKPRELLYYLLDHPDATKDQIGAALWPWASAARLRSSFHTTLHHLRSALGEADRIRYTGGRYTFNRTLPHRYDVAEFEDLLAQARDAEEAEDALAAAVAVYRGDYLADLTGEAWIDERRATLRRSFERALLSLGRLHVAGARYPDAIEVLHRAVSLDPLHESAHRELMRSYAAAGDRGLALRQYQTLRGVLRDELGAAPARETAELYDRIRGGAVV